MWPVFDLSWTMWVMLVVGAGLIWVELFLRIPVI